MSLQKYTNSVGEWGDDDVAAGRGAYRMGCRLRG